MLPIVLTEKSIRIGLAGSGEGYQRRLALLVDAGVTPVLVAAEGPLPNIRVLFVAGLANSEAAALSRLAAAQGILVNVEDVPELCDFHVPAIVRRGDLVLTASTGGSAPGLARRLREWLEDRFGPEWSGRLDDVKRARAGWRNSGLGAGDVSTRTRQMISEKGWLS